MKIIIRGIQTDRIPLGKEASEQNEAGRGLHKYKTFTKRLFNKLL